MTPADATGSAPESRVRFVNCTMTPDVHERLRQILYEHVCPGCGSTQGRCTAAAIYRKAMRKTDETIVSHRATETRIREEIAHAEVNGHRLDPNCQGVGPGETVPAVRVDHLRAALVTAPPQDDALVLLVAEALTEWSGHDEEEGALVPGCEICDRAIAHARAWLKRG